MTPRSAPPLNGITPGIQAAVVNSSTPLPDRKRRLRPDDTGAGAFHIRLKPIFTKTST